MHYYQRHLGDYSTATPHLSLTEHGAYTRLLDYYYSTEHPIPDDRCERIAGAFDPHERDAVRAVLQQFFMLTDAGWANDRADSEIAAYRAKSLKAKESAEARWKRAQCDGNANAYPNAMLTSNQELVAKKEQKQKTGSPAGSRLPDDWFLPDDWRRWAEQERSDVDPIAEAAKFADFWHGKAGKDARKADWLATWRNWIRRADGIRSRTNPQQQPGKRVQALMRLEAMKNGLGDSGNHNGDTATLLPRPGSGASF